MPQKIVYPYIPDGRTIIYVKPDNEYMRLAKEFARANSLDRAMPGAAVIVRDNKILGIGTNGSEYHKKHTCRRKELGCKTGEGYELCEGCHPRNHSEPSAIRDAQKMENATRGSDLYLWGHWWCCKPCWDVMEEAGIRNVYLLADSEKLFDKERPGNIVGRQFDD